MTTAEFTWLKLQVYENGKYKEIYEGFGRRIPEKLWFRQVVSIKAEHYTLLIDVTPFSVI